MSGYAEVQVSQPLRSEIRMALKSALLSSGAPEVAVQPSGVGITTMSVVQPCEVPANSLLRSYCDGTGFADCYQIEVQGAVTQAAFIEAFYTSPLFKAERTLLKYLAAKPATDADAKQLAEGKVAEFSAWRVEGQSTSELLLADFTGRTRSWLKALPSGAPHQTASTRLYFGSAVAARHGDGNQKARMGWLFHALLGFHRLYSRLLLGTASKRVRPS